MSQDGSDKVRYEAPANEFIPPLTEELRKKILDPAETISEITGIKVKYFRDPQPYEGKYLRGQHPLQNKLEGSFGDKGIPGSFRVKSIAGPAFKVVEQEGVTPLANYLGTEKVAMAAKDFGTWRSVFCGIPRVESQLLHNLAAWANAWRVSDPYDAVYASQHFLTIHALHPGEKVLRLKYPSWVTDMTSGQRIGTKKTQTLRTDMPFGQTRWFQLEP